MILESEGSLPVDLSRLTTRNVFQLVQGKAKYFPVGKSGFWYFFKDRDISRKPFDTLKG